MKASVDEFDKREHMFDMDAEPEPVPVECDAIADDDIVDDSFGPVGDDDDYDDDNYDRGLSVI